jgi:hypothetical protein
MSYGFKVVLDNGRIIDSSKLTGMIHDIFVVSGGETGSKSYPELTGYEIYATSQKFSATPAGIVQVLVSYSGELPIVSWSPTNSGSTPSNATILVFVK